MVQNETAPHQTSAALPWYGEPGDAEQAARIKALVDDAETIVITGHERPDGDCIGSESALRSILEALGKRVTIVNSDPTPEKYRFLDPGDRIVRWSDNHSIKADLVCVLDSTDLRRLGRVNVETFGAKKSVNIDHHLGNPNFATVNFVDTKAAAVGEIIWRVAACNRWPAPPLALNAMYTALATDTGQFAYGNTTSRVLRIAAELRDLGVDSEDVWRRVYQSRSMSELQLESRARNSLQCLAGGRICCVSLTKKDFDETGTTPEHAEDLVGIPRSLRGVELALFLYEVNGGASTKASIRATRNLDACALARSFGGGGHRQAAGCTLPGALHEASPKVLSAAIEFISSAP